MEQPTFNLQTWLQSLPVASEASQASQASQASVVCKTQNACIYLRQTLVNQYNDAQYEEAKYAEDTANLVSVSELKADKTWAIVNPSAFCVFQVQLVVPGSKVFVFARPYLLSPKAQKYFKTQPLYKEVATISYQTVHQTDEVPVHTVYLLFKNKLKSTFDHFTALRHKNITETKEFFGEQQPNHSQKQAGTRPVEALLAAIEKEFNLKVEPHWFTLHGKWVIQKKYNPVIDYHSTVRTRVYTLNLTRSKIHHLLKQLQVFPSLSNVNIRDTVALQVRNQASSFSQVMLFHSSDLAPESPRKFMQPICHNVLCRLYNKPTLAMTSSVKLFQVTPYPMYAQSAKEEKVATE